MLKWRKEDMKKFIAYDHTPIGRFVQERRRRNIDGEEDRSKSKQLL